MANSPRNQSRELRRLIWTELTDGLSPEGGQHLRDLLLTDAGALSEYVAYTRLLTDVRVMTSPELLLNSIAMDRNASYPLSRLTSWVVAAGDAIKMQPRQAALWSVALAVNAVIVVLLSMAVAPQFWKRWDLARPQIEKSESITTARLVSATDCNWIGNVPTVGSHFTAQTLALRSGSALIEFGKGAQVVIEGPCEFAIQTMDRGYLRRGSLVARVPQQAIGFTVETPTAKIVDLGTEFGVETDERGMTEVQVFKGNVRLHPGATTDDSSPALSAITLGAGMARRIEAPHGRAALVQRIDARPNRFSAQFLAAMSKRIAVSGVMASSEFPGRGPNNLINGSGMHGDRHDNDPEAGIMWLSDGSPVEGQYILFDLGKLSRIESLKVWNCNESSSNVYAARGVKQADIYVSDTGKVNPLTNPQEWRLVVADQKFSAADGTAEYATPDTIALGNVEARFVAIVIDERLGHDPTQPNMHYVGLSEVQFFGEPVVAPAARTSK
jgi:hypothetical protein